MKVPATLVVLSAMGAILRAVHGVSDEEVKAFCAITPYSCSDSQELCSRGTYDPFLRSSRYSSGLGDFCDEKNGTLTRVYFKNTGLKTLGSEIGVLTDLTHLELSGNSLTSLPNSLRYLKNLTYLYKNVYLFYLLFIVYSFIIYYLLLLDP